MATNPLLMNLLGRLGRPPGGGGPGPGPATMETVRNATAGPSPQQDMQNLDQIRTLIGALVPSISMRAPRLAAKLATALHSIDEVKKGLAAMPEYSVSPPPPGMPTGSPITGGDVPQPGGVFLPGG